MFPELIRSRPPPGGGASGGLPNYWNPQRLEPSIILPSNYLDVRPVAGVGAWGAWKQVQPAIAEDLVLLALHVNVITTASMSCWLQVGVDPAGGANYVAIAGAGMHAFIGGTGSAPIHGSTLRLAPNKILAGSSVGIRAYKTAGDTRVAAYLSLIKPSAAWYSPWPNTYIAGGRASGPFRFPAVPNWLVSVQQPAWTSCLFNGPGDMLLTAAEWDPTRAAGIEGDVIEVGVGPAGSEVVLARVGIPSNALNGWPVGYQEFGRKAIIRAYETVSVRHWWLASAARVALYLEYLT